MPEQEVFFEQTVGNSHIAVVKVYDQGYAREAFGHMDDISQAYLWRSLGIDGSYDPAEVPSLRDPTGEDFLWQELLEAAREDGNLLSFFVVTETRGMRPQPLYVSPDWLSAEMTSGRGP